MPLIHAQLTQLRLVNHLHQLGAHGAGDDGVLAFRQGRLEDVPQLLS